MDIEKIGKDVLDSAFAIHSRFGSGLLEKAYRIFLAAELRRLGHSVEEEKNGTVVFNGTSYENMLDDDKELKDIMDMVISEVKHAGIKEDEEKKDEGYNAELDSAFIDTDNK